jgi:hypothetical protein
VGDDGVGQGEVSDVHTGRWDRNRLKISGR